jgi:hypothetical protein
MTEVGVYHVTWIPCAAAIGLFIIAPTWAGLYSGGTGTASDPYQITTVADWHELTETVADWDQHFLLTASLDFGGAATPSAGTWTHRFTGLFDGGGHVLRRVVIHRAADDDVGLFGCLGVDAVVHHLGVEEVDVRGDEGVGALVGRCYGTLFYCHAAGTVQGTKRVGGLVGDMEGTMTSCYATGTVSATSHYVGGLIGWNLWSQVCDCYTTTTVNGGGSNVGGLVGYSSQGTLSSCQTSGEVTGSNTSVGGLVGYNIDTIVDCHATGSVSGAASVGGLTGTNDGAIRRSSASGTVNASGSNTGGLVGCNMGLISASFATGHVVGSGSSVGGLAGENSCGSIVNSYAWGSVEGGSNVGGLVGFMFGDTIVSSYAVGPVSGSRCGGLVGSKFDGTVIDCFWDFETTNQMTSGGGQSQTSGMMKTQSTFTAAGWDFVGETANGTADVWRLCEDRLEYPQLSWEYARTGDFDCPAGVAMEDLTFLVDHWLVVYPDALGRADGNADGIVDQRDFAILAEHWLAGM